MLNDHVACLAFLDMTEQHELAVRAPQRILHQRSQFRLNLPSDADRLSTYRFDCTAHETTTIMSIPEKVRLERKRSQTMLDTKLDCSASGCIWAASARASELLTNAISTQVQKAITAICLKSSSANFM